MIDHFADLFPAEAAVGMNGIPVLFIHVIARLNFGMTLAQLNGQFRIAFDVELRACRNACQQKKLFSHAEYQCVFAEWRILGDTGLAEAVIAYFFNIQG